LIEECNLKSIKIAKQAVAGKDVSVAGSVSTYGYFMKDGIKKMKPSFDQHLSILSNAGVDLVILEAMSSQADIVEVLASHNPVRYYQEPAIHTCRHKPYRHYPDSESPIHYYHPWGSLPPYEL